MTKADASPRTTQLLQLLEQYRSGDSTAGDKLALQVYERLRQLADQMLRTSPRLKGNTTSEDLTQGAMARLTKALQEVRLESVRHFHNLAAVQLRRELVDLARRCQRMPAKVAGQVDVVEPPSNLDRWIDLHDAMAELDGDDRDLIDDLVYMGQSQHEIAAELGVSAKTVQRRWHSLCVRLHDRLGGRLPDL